MKDIELLKEKIKNYFKNKNDLDRQDSILFNLQMAIQI